MASAEEDALATQDDELDRHPDMLPLVRFIEKAATLAGDAPQPLQAGGAAPCQWITGAYAFSWSAVLARVSALRALTSRCDWGAV